MNGCVKLFAYVSSPATNKATHAHSTRVVETVWTSGVFRRFDIRFELWPREWFLAADTIVLYFDVAACGNGRLACRDDACTWRSPLSLLRHREDVLSRSRRQSSKAV